MQSLFLETLPADDAANFPSVARKSVANITTSKFLGLVGKILILIFHLSDQNIIHRKCYKKVIRKD